MLQVGGLLSGASDIATNDIKRHKEAKKAAEGRVSQLKSKVSELTKNHGEEKSKLDAELRAARTRADEAKRASGLLKTRVEELEK